MYSAEIEEFYREFLTLLNIGVTDDGYLYQETPEDDSEYITEDGIPYRLPVQNYASEQMKAMDDGSVRPVFHLYNPLVENQLDLHQGDIELTAKLLSRQISGGLIPALMSAGKLASGEEEVGSTNSTKMDLVERLGIYSGQHPRVQLGDKKWVSLIKRLAKEYYRDIDTSFVTIKPESGNKQYTAIAKSYCTLLEAIEDDTDGRIFGMVWRVKDKDLATMVLETIFNTNPLVSHTKRTVAGVLSVMMSAYITVGNHINKLLGESTESFTIDLGTMTHLRNSIGKLENKIKMFPPPTPRKSAAKKEPTALKTHSPRPPKAPPSAPVSQPPSAPSYGQPPTQSPTNENIGDALSEEELSRLIYPTQATPVSYPTPYPQAPHQPAYGQPAVYPTQTPGYPPPIPPQPPQQPVQYPGGYQQQPYGGYPPQQPYGGQPQVDQWGRPIQNPLDFPFKV